MLSHISGEEEAIRVMSLKPPAAKVFISSFDVSFSRTILTSEAATICGTWLIAAVISS